MPNGDLQKCGMIAQVQAYGPPRLQWRLRYHQGDTPLGDVPGLRLALPIVDRTFVSERNQINRGNDIQTLKAALIEHFPVFTRQELIETFRASVL
jgi:hypothetical protein